MPSMIYTAFPTLRVSSFSARWRSHKYIHLQRHLSRHRGSLVRFQEKISDGGSSTDGSSIQQGVLKLKQINPVDGTASRK